MLVNFDNWQGFCLFSELIDGYIQVFVATDGCWEGSQNVESPDCKRPGEGNQLQRLCWSVNLFGMELARFASLDKLHRILKSCGPVKSMPKSLAYQCACSRVASTLAFMNVDEDASPFFP